ncbi:MAG: hypothetical protein AAB508_00575 [Patescibacteria group bacterium]
MPAWKDLPLIVLALVAGLGTGMLVGLWRLGFFTKSNQAKGKIKRDSNGGLEKTKSENRTIQHIFSISVLVISAVFTVVYIEVGLYIAPLFRLGALLSVGLLFLISEVYWKLGKFTWKEFFDPVELWITLVILVVFILIFVISLIVPPVAIVLIAITVFEIFRRGDGR